MGFIEWLGDIGNKIKSGFQTAGNWINQNVIQPVGSWGKGFIQGISGGRAFNDITPEDLKNNTALRLGSESGNLGRNIGVPIIKGAAGLLGFGGVANALDRVVPPPDS